MGALQLVHTVAFEDAALASTAPATATGSSIAKGGGDVRIDDAQVWTLSSRVRRTDLHEPFWRPSGLDVRLGARTVPDPRGEARERLAPMKTWPSGVTVCVQGADLSRAGQVDGAANHQLGDGLQRPLLADCRTPEAARVRRG